MTSTRTSTCPVGSQGAAIEGLVLQQTIVRAGLVLLRWSFVRW